MAAQEDTEQIVGLDAQFLVPDLLGRIPETDCQEARLLLALSPLRRLLYLRARRRSGGLKSLEDAGVGPQLLSRRSSQSVAAAGVRA